ncbi:uncharacterized protein [Macrobrachium rosenbergii]|uniref:uncharacterized protein isoform X2 n=1 Tax=Macrobrachium rosenbergii TaxID=79674 RepID=UPI0034D4BA08
MSVNLGNDTKATSPVRTPDEAKEGKYEPKQNKKIVRLLTVIAYVISVSMAAIILSLYYVFLWDPQLKYSNTEKAKMDSSPFATPDTGETRMAAENNLLEPKPTPYALPVIPETNHHHSSHQPHHNGQATLSNNNHQSSGPSPQQGKHREASPTDGSSSFYDDFRQQQQQQQQQQQHGQPPLSTSA